VEQADDLPVQSLVPAGVRGVVRRHG
jgi:hypothetical protein